MRQRNVAGESIELLRAALGQLRYITTNDGMVELSGHLEPELGHPLRRAILRIEKELLAQEATPADPGTRTAEQRRADAFVLLTRRLTSAIERS